MMTLTDARTALESIRTLRTLTGAPTATEAQVLARWTGWGPLAPAFEPDVRGGWAEIANELDELFLKHPADLLAARDILDTSFYTPPAVIDAVYTLLRATGFTGGRALEPGCGSGRFMTGTPADLDIDWTGVEMDPTSAAIAQALNPHADVIASPMQKLTFTTGEFDISIGNVPFSSASVFDPAYPHCNSLHEYFLMRALDAVREGGYVIAITSRFTMDALNGLEHIRKVADIAGAVRLPSGAFSEDGTEVTTDIVLLRRRTAGAALQGWDDKKHNVVEYSNTGFGYYGGRTTSNRLKITEPIAEGRRADSVEVNNYWREHPEHVAGVMRVTGNMHNPLSVLTDDPATAVSRAVSAVASQLLPLLPRFGSLAPEEDFADVHLTDAEGRKSGSFHLVDGAVHVVTAGKLEPVTRASAELRLLISLRDAAVALVEAEADLGATDTVLDPLRAAARAAYTAYVAKHGALNRGDLVAGKEDPETGQPSYTWKRPTMGGFRRDPDYVTVMALEQFDQETNAAKPAPILLGRVNHAPVPVERVDTPDEAIAVTLGEGLGLDLARIAYLLGLTDETDAAAALGDRIYADPSRAGALTLDRDYLSGNVRRKLGDALEAAASDPTYNRNVTALQQVHPTELGPLEIRVSLGAPWISADDVRAFAKETFGVHHPAITHTPIVATWEVDTGHHFTPAAKITWGTEDKNPLELLDCALNGKAPTVMDDVLVDGVWRKRRNTHSTIAAEDKLRAINERFSLWVWEDEARSERICTEYNERFNSHVARRHDGAYLTFPGMSEHITLWDHQKDMIDRVISTPRVLCGHAVGSGKTLSMIGSAMSLRRFGLAKKPMIAVPKHLLEQIAREAQQAFPTGRFLIAGEEDLKKENRRLFAARCATGDYDLIVMTHQAFTSLPVDPTMESRWIEEQKSELRGHLQGFGQYDQKSKGAKAVARAVRSLESRLEALRYNTAKDDQVRFDQLGIDYIAVDECFPSETLVETDQGTLPIGQIVERGMKVSVASTNLSTGVVEFKPIRRWVKKEHNGPLIRIRHEAGEFTCTPNHPVWVEGRGYTRAEAVATGDTVRTMREVLPAENDQVKVLLGVMQNPVEHGKEREASDLPRVRGDVHTEASDSNLLLETLQRFKQGEAAGGVRHVEEDARLKHRPSDAGACASSLQGTDAGKQPHEKRGDSGENEGDNFQAGARLLASEWWEREADGSTVAIGGTDGPADGIQYLDQASEAFVRVSTAFLLSRSGRGGIEAVYRSGREQPQNSQSSIAGQEENGGLGSSRVVSVEVLERGGSKRHGQSDSGDQRSYVYNLEVADNHNYFANGVLVSNCHAFKRLQINTNAEGFSLGHSKRATDLLLKIETLAQRFPDKPIVGLFTGTPWSNTIAETYVWQKYLQPERLADAGVAMFDAWAANFVRFESRVEVSPDGATFRIQRRPSVIQNVPELMGMLGEVADILTADDIGLERPDATFENVGVDASDEQLDFVAGLADRSERLRGGGKQMLEDGRQDNMLLICTDGRKAALDPSLLGLPGGSPKILAAADRIAGIYQATKDTTYPGLATPGALQVAFCDYGTPHPGDGQSYGRLRAELVHRGVPAERIRWIHEAKTSKAREALFAQCRGGDVSVLIGSTETMGMGTNIQQRLIALHHVDAPWRPSDMTQRDGRALRPGNLNPAVDILRYVTIGTFDGFMWQGLERKARFIAQMLDTGSTVREVEDVSESELTYGEVKALAAGNPMLMQHTELQSEVKRLMTMRSVFQRSVNAARGRASDGRRDAESRRRLVAKIKDGQELMANASNWNSGRLESVITRIMGAKTGAASYGTDGHWRGLSVEVERHRDQYYSSKIAMGPEAALIIKAGYDRIGSLAVRRSKLRNPEKALAYLNGELQEWWDQLVDRIPTLLDRAAELDAEAVAADQAAAEAIFDGAPKLAAAVAKLEALEAAMAADAAADQREPVAA